MGHYYKIDDSAVVEKHVWKCRYFLSLSSEQFSSFAIINYQNEVFFVSDTVTVSIIPTISPSPINLTFHGLDQIKSNRFFSWW